MKLYGDGQPEKPSGPVAKPPAFMKIISKYDMDFTTTACVPDRSNEYDEYRRYRSRLL